MDRRKNFDATGAFDLHLLPRMSCPPVCKGLHFETHLNEMVVQMAAIDDLIFDVESLVSILSEVLTLAPGDVIITGTPGGVGLAPQASPVDEGRRRWHDLLEAVGVLRNPIVEEASAGP